MQKLIKLTEKRSIRHGSITDARFADAPEVICESSKCAVFVLENWQAKGKSRRYKVKLVGGTIMSVSDPIADMLTKIRNAASAGHESVDVPSSKMKWEIISILKSEGYIKNFKK